MLIRCKRCTERIEVEGIDVTLDANEHIFRRHDIAPTLDSESFFTYFIIEEYEK